MDNHALAEKAAELQIKLLGREMTYHDPHGNRLVMILIERNVRSIGPNGSLNESAYAISFTTEEISDPRRGEIISDASGKWRLDRELPSSDFYISQWAVTRI